MRQKAIHVWVVSAAIAACAAAACAQSPGRAAKPRPLEYPHAGIALAVPRGFAPCPAAGAYDIMRAVRKQNERAVQGVTLSAYCVAEKVTADLVADDMLQRLKDDLAFRRVRLLKKTPMTVAGIRAAGRKIRYTLRGEETIAARVYFIRALPGTRVRICYVLTVEAVAEKDGDLLRVLGETIKTVTLTSPRHPAAIPVERLGEPVKDYKRGYGVRPPAGWFATVTPLGVRMGQVDYLLGGQLMPTVDVMVGAVPPARTAEACAKEAMQLAIGAAVESGLTATVLSQGPAKLGVVAGYQFVLRQAVRPKPAMAPADKNAQAQPPVPPVPVLIVQRTICARPPARPRPASRPGHPGAPGPATQPTTKPTRRFSYSLVLITQGVKPAAAAAMMDKIAPGFELFCPDEPLPAPATAPAATTRPAGTHHPPRRAVTRRP